MLPSKPCTNLRLRARPGPHRVQVKEEDQGMVQEMDLPEETLEAGDVDLLWAVLLRWVGVLHMDHHPFPELPSTDLLPQVLHHTLGDHLWDFHLRSGVPHLQCIAALLLACLLRDLHQWCMGHQFSVPLQGFLQQDHHLSLGLMSTPLSSPLGLL